MSEIKNIRDQFISKLKNDLSTDQINEIKTELFGKNGLISSKFKTIGSIPETDRKKFASDLIWFISEISNFPLSFERNSSFIFLRSDIFTDYFFREIKQ